jgi:hypothetical protein
MLLQSNTHVQVRLLNLKCSAGPGAKFKPKKNLKTGDGKPTKRFETMSRQNHNNGNGGSHKGIMVFGNAVFHQPARKARWSEEVKTVMLAYYQQWLDVPGTAKQATPARNAIFSDCVARLHALGCVSPERHQILPHHVQSFMRYEQQKRGDPIESRYNTG